MPAAHLSCNGALNHVRKHLSRLGGLQHATRNDCKITDSRSASKNPVFYADAKLCDAAAAMICGVFLRLVAHLSCDGALHRARNLLSGLGGLQHTEMLHMGRDM